MKDVVLHRKCCVLLNFFITYKDILRWHFMFFKGKNKPGVKPQNSFRGFGRCSFAVLNPYTYQ